MASYEEIVDAIVTASAQQPRVVVGVSGFGGSGKSTLVRSLSESIAGAVRLRGDDFLDPKQSHHRSADWSGVERMRLRSEVLGPFRAGEQCTFRRYDWRLGALGPPELLPDAVVLIVDAIGIFHPELDGFFDLRVWMDVELEAATTQGKTRDRSLGRDHDRLWDEVWAPNELEFSSQFAPHLAADLTYSGSSSLECG